MATLQNENQCENVVKDLKISRGELPDINLDFKRIENLYVLDEEGVKVRVGEIYKDQKTILVLVRHFLCFICKEYVEDLALIPEAYLKQANVQLVVIGCSKPKFIIPFRCDTGYNGKIYVDPDRELYKALECKEQMNLTKTKCKGSKHVKSGMLSGTMQSMVRGMRYCEFQGDVNQQGGAFILGPGNQVELVHLDNVSTDHMPINDLLALAGVDQVNFDHDKRVLEV